MKKLLLVTLYFIPGMIFTSEGAQSASAANYVDAPDMHPLLAAAEKSSPKKIVELLAAFHDPREREKYVTEAINETGATALMHAIWDNRSENIDPLMNAFTSYASRTQYLNQKDEKGHTALMHAVCENNPQCCKKLLELGANPWLTSNGGSTALSLAAARNKSEAIEALFSAIPPHERKHYCEIKSNWGNALIQIAKYPKSGVEALRTLFQGLPNDIEKNEYLMQSKDNAENTVLMWSIRTKKEAITKELSEMLKGFPFTARRYLAQKNQKGETARDIAVTIGNEEMVALIDELFTSSRKRKLEHCR